MLHRGMNEEGLDATPARLYRGFLARVPMYSSNVCKLKVEKLHSFSSVQDDGSSHVDTHSVLNLVFPSRDPLVMASSVDILSSRDWVAKAFRSSPLPFFLGNFPQGIISFDVASEPDSHRLH